MCVTTIYLLKQNVLNHTHTRINRNCEFGGVAHTQFLDSLPNLILPVSSKKSFLKQYAESPFKSILRHQGGAWPQPSFLASWLPPWPAQAIVAADRRFVVWVIGEVMGTHFHRDVYSIFLKKVLDNHFPLCIVTISLCEILFRSTK